MKRILVAEDEQHIRDFVVINLKRSGFEVTEARDGLESIAAFDNAAEPFSVVLLDIMMPNADGVEVCKHIRQSSKSVGIMMLTAKSQELDKVTLLELGADDYVTKPFSVAELMARVEALYRRVSRSSEQPSSSGQPSSPSVLIQGPFSLDLQSRTLKKSGNLIELTQVEFQIMETFFANPSVPLDRGVILYKVWGESYYGAEKIVDVNIRRLRVKLEDNSAEPQYITTVWGRGYRWET